MAGRTLDQRSIGSSLTLPGQTKILLGIGAIIATAFFIDILSPSDLTAGLLLNYFAIYLSTKFKEPRLAYAIMAIVSVLAVIGFFAKPDLPIGTDLANRLFIFATLWAMSALAYRRVIQNQEIVVQRAAIESGKTFRDLFDNSRLGIQLADLDGKRLMVNKAQADLLGYASEAELMAVPLENITAPHDRERAAAMRMIKEAKGDLPPAYEIDALRKDGSVIPFQVFWRTLDWGGELAVQRIFIDISERKRAEAALAEKERQYRDLIEENPLGIQIVDGRGNRLLINRAFVKMLGYESAEEIKRIPWKGFLAPDDQVKALSLEEIEKFGTDGPNTVELNLVRKDGSILPVQIFRRVLVWEGEKAIQRTYIDISERKRAQQALVSSEKQYRNLIERAPLGMQISDRDGNKLLANKALATLLGYDEGSDVLALPSQAIVAREEGYTRVPFEEVDKPGSKYPQSREIDLRRKDGLMVPVQVLRRKLIWEGRESVQRTYVDLSERKRAQQALVESEKQYRDLIEQAVLGIQILARDGKRLLVNNALLTLLGYENSKEIIALPKLGFIAPHHHRRALTFAEMADSENQNATSREIDLVRKDGSFVPVEIFQRTVSWEGNKAVQLTYIDLSERKRAEEALAESEAQYRDLIEGARLGIQLSDRDRNRLLVNQALVDMLGYASAEDVKNVKHRGFVAPYDRDKTLSFKKIEEAEDDIPVSLEVDLLRKDGSTLPVQMFWRMLDWGGKPILQRTYIDISERKRAEAALLDSEQRYRGLFEGSSLGLRITDAHGNRVTNPAMAALLGYDSVEDIKTLPRRQLIAPHDRDRAITFEMIQSGADNLPTTMELDLVRKDGSILPVQVFWQILKWEGVKAVERTYIDISERREHERVLRERDRTVQELRQALARASRISAMGEISSVIAHELHQPLAAIANTASAAQRRLADTTVEKSAVLDEMLPLIVDQANRAGNVIGGIRKLFEGGSSERSIENLEAIVDEACALATNEFQAENVAITREFENSAVTALIDKVQIQQVIYNLLRNANDAIQDVPDKNVIVSIRTEDDQTVRISVQDNGPGLSPDVTSTLFDPFVTTKEKGMGMGLYTCQHIVESHGGRIWAESDGSNGTIVEFTLPLAGQLENVDGSVH